MPPLGQFAEDGIVVANVGWIPDGEKDTQACVLLTLSAQISYYLQVRTRATSFTRHNAQPVSPVSASGAPLRRLR